MSSREADQALIRAARQLEPDNEKLVESGDSEETRTGVIEARRVLRAHDGTE